MFLIFQDLTPIEASIPLLVPQRAAIEIGDLVVHSVADILPGVAVHLAGPSAINKGLKRPRWSSQSLWVGGSRLGASFSLVMNKIERSERRGRRL